MEQFEIQNNWMANINPENEDEEMENKEQELTLPLFELLLVDYPEREDMAQQFTDIEDFVINDVSRRDTMISSKAKTDAINVRNKITTQQHKRNRDIIREIVTHTSKLHRDVDEKFDELREDIGV